MTNFQEIDRALCAERFGAAKEALAQISDGPARWARASRAALGLGEGSPLEAMRLAEAAADALPDSDPDKARALEIALDAALRCRTRRTAEAYLARLEALRPGSSRSRAYAGKLAIVFDERERAREQLVAAHAQNPECPLARGWLAELEYIEGRFAEALRLLGPFLEAASDGENVAAGLRLIAHCHGALGAYAEEARVLARLVERFPDGVRAGADRLELAFARAGAGDYDGAARELRALWERDPKSGLGRYVRRRLDHLEATSAAGPARRLEQFPTTHQKRNFCGPAVLELCLRFLGIELGQDEIAGVVKRETGTPMYEITAFLAARGILSRRIAATPERLRAAIDLGLPVIVQEEYSTTSHVAVITGYDARLGTFITQDPMTHRPELKAYEWTENAGYHFGNGGVVVIGREGAVSPEQLQAIGAAGLVEQPHLVLLDGADRRRASLDGQSEEAHTDEVLEACSLALRDAPYYPLAWSRRAWALYSRWQSSRNGAARGELLDFLQRSRTTFRGAEWAHRVHAAFLEADGRFREAYVEHLQTHRADPADAGNLDDMADCLRQLGELADAEARFHQAVECQPSYLRAAENLAALYVTALGGTRPGTWFDADAVPWVPPPTSTAVKTPLAHDESELVRRARWYTGLALRENPDNSFNQLQAGVLAALSEEFGPARERLAAAAERRDGDWIRGLEARAAILGGDQEAATRVAELLRQRHPTTVAAWLWTAEIARRAGDFEAAYSALREGVRRVGSARQELVEALWQAGKKFGGNEAAAVRLREVVEEAPHDPEFVRAVANKADSEHQRGIAVDLLRATLELEPGDINVRFRLGRLLGEDPSTQEEAQALLSEVVRQAPDAAVARQALAWTYLESDPEQGLEVLGPLLEEGDPKVLETAGVLALRAGDRERGEDLRQRALATYATETEGRIDLCHFHLYSDRYDLAAELVMPIRDSREHDDLESLESAVLTAARLSGRQMELIDWVRARAAEKVPEHLAWETYWSYRHAAFELAARAAEAHAAEQDDPEDALEFRINAAACRARATGSVGDLDAIAREVGDDGKAWAHLYFAYDGAKHFEHAAEAARKARAHSPHDLYCLSAWESFCLDEGDVEGAFDAARAALERHPYQHLGNERLALLHGRALEPDEALAHSLRAVRLAPFCHLAQTSRAIAFFAAGDLEQAEPHALRAVKLETRAEPDEWNEAEAILRALRGDLDGLERLFADRSVRRRKWPFSEFDERLREVASRARPG